jgi:sucrose-phosphate synthase
MSSAKGLYIVLISVHGLIRGNDLELGRDSDTGGQTKYVVELARALAKRAEVARVDLLTRRIVDSSVHADYAVQSEPLGDKANIIRIDAGPRGYIRKEELWDHLDNFADNTLTYFRDSDQLPDVVHGHYADAGYVALRVANLLGVPMVFTGHSLGRVKRRHLLASGLTQAELENQYHISRRIEAEEESLAAADLVVVSTHNEIEEQYGLYDHYLDDHMRVIPPGTDLQRFQPPLGGEWNTETAKKLISFLRDPFKPMILALSRPDRRKNISGLVEAYGESPELQKMANLVIIAGNREDIREMEDDPQQVLTELLLIIDSYDLYGKVAYPRRHDADEVEIFYRLAASSHGVFVNPALTEPFGLTLLEAAASGVPVVATEDGGPIDILKHCRNGSLVDPLDSPAMAKTLLKVLSDVRGWQTMVSNGLAGVHAHYCWESHASTYLEQVSALGSREIPVVVNRPPATSRPMLYHDRAVFADLDQSLLGDPASLAALMGLERAHRKQATIGITTGRRLDSALRVIKRYGMPQPDVLITSVGTEIRYAPQLTLDKAWTQHIDYLWNRLKIRRVLADVPGLELQEKGEQSDFKVSYYIDLKLAPAQEEINSLLRKAELTVNTFLSFGQFLDILPVRASKGFALRYFADRWGIPLGNILTAGGSGTDEDMIRGNTLAVVVGNRHEEELAHLADVEPIYYASAPYAGGILEAIDHYDFYGKCVPPPPATDSEQ